jgi:uncharacterized protein YaaN involved in tellurite resistance
MSDEFSSLGDTPAAPTLEFGAAAAQVQPQEKAEEKVQETAVNAADFQDALTPEERAEVDAFVKQIDLSNTSGIMNYGVGTQKKLADFSQKAIDNVRTKDMGEVGDMLSGLVTELKNFDVDENEKGIAAFFKKKANKVEALKNRYAKVETNVQAVSEELERHQIQLLKDADLMDKMYELNLSYFHELTMYIAAGKQKLGEVRSGELKDLEQKAAESGLAEDAQKAKDLAAQCDRFEKKIYDLELTRTVALQTAPEIRMVQDSDTVMAEKIQSTIVNTIPLWKNQMVIAIGLDHAAKAARAEREVNDMTNQLLQKNAAALKAATVETAKESERGIVDIETLKNTNATLISAMDEILKIQTEGKEKRKAAEGELVQIENELKAKLLEAARS